MIYKKTSLPSLLILMVGISAQWAQAQVPSWHGLKAEGSATERHENALVRAGNKFFLIGGRGMKPMDIYDTETEVWSQGAQPPFEIHHIQAVTLDGLVFVIGAMTGGWPHETPLSHILIYDPLLNKWAIGPEIPNKRRRGAAGVVTYDGKIYVVGGIINGHTSGWVSWLDEFNPSTNQWQELPNAPRERDHLHAAVIDDKLYVAGGRRSGYADSGFEATVKETNVFNFKTQEWKELPSPSGDIPTERAGTAAAVYNGNFVVIGGESGSQQSAHDAVQMLDVAKGTWESLPSLKRGRHGTQAIFFDDIIVVGAGSGDRGGGPELTSFEIFANSENPDIPSHNLTKSDITVSANEVLFPNDLDESSKQVTFKSVNGNQANLVTNIEVDNTKDFSLHLPSDPPFILPPGQQITIELSRKSSSANDVKATLFLKTLGDSAPVKVEIKVD